MRLIMLLCALFLTACANSGPNPADLEYARATKSLNESQEAVYVLTADWVRDAVMGSLSSFANVSDARHGKLFIGEKSITFASYDSTTSSFIRAYRISYSDIDWLTNKKHGVSRIIRLQSNDSSHSFIFSTALDASGSRVDKDEVLRFIEQKNAPNVP